MTTSTHDPFAVSVEALERAYETPYSSVPESTS